MNKEALEARLAELKQAVEQCQAQFYKLAGAVADTEYWIAEADKLQEPETAKD